MSGALLFASHAPGSLKAVLLEFCLTLKISVFHVSLNDNLNEDEFDFSTCCSIFWMVVHSGA